MERESQSDARLVEQCLTGDIEAFTTLVDRYQVLVYAVAFSVTANAASSEDVTQETFLVAWKELSSLREESKLPGWLSGIARNISRKSLKKREREVLGYTSSTEESQQASAVDQLADREQEKILTSALETLDDTYRETLVLFYVANQSAKEVGKLLSVSEDTVHKRLSRGRSQLRSEVEASLARAASIAMPVGLSALIANSLAACGTEATTTLSQPTPLETKAGTITMTSILKWAAIAVTMVAAGGLTTWALAGTHDSEKQEERADVEKTASAESKSPERKVPTLSVDRPTPTNEDPASANTSPDPSSLVLPQEGYEVTTLGPTRVAIRLAGGPSKVVSASSMGFRDPQNPPAFTHVVSGRILDKTGAPVAGAAILADSSPRQSFTSLMGSAGAMSDASGRFDLTLHKEGRIFVLALHKDHGWSKVESVTTKEGGSDITLRFDEPGVIKGTVSYNKEPVASNIRLASRFTLDDHALELDLKTDEDGRYEFALLPIGDYTLIATQRYSFGGGGARIVEKKVSVKAGGVEIVDFEIDGGSLLVGDVSVPEGELPPSTVEYWLFEGSQTLPTLESIRALAKQLGRGHYQNILYGGKDALTPIQFHDLSPGPVTFCAQYKKQDREVAWLRCTQVEVSSKAEVQEVHFP